MRGRLLADALHRQDAGATFFFTSGGETLTKLILIAMCGGLGAVTRYAVSGWVQRATGSVFPWGTFAVNATGCLLIGLLAAFFAGPTLVREEYRVAILVGLLGGLTTFSSFGWETLALATDGQWGWAIGNVLLNNAVGLVVAWGGYRIGGFVWGG